MIRNSQTTQTGESSTQGSTITLVTVCIALFMLLLDVTIVAVALPDIQQQFNANLSSLQWIVDAYTLPLAVLLLTIAVAGDRYGRTTFFIAGLALFTAASVGCALAPDILWLNVLRVIQGIGAAAMMGIALPLISAAYPTPAGRARAIGIYGAVMGLAIASGPIVGGVLVEYLDWRWIFLINVPIGLVALALTRYIPNSADSDPVKIDLPGTLAATAALTAVVLALVDGNAWGWTAPATLALFAVAILSTVAFITIEYRSPNPMVDIRLVSQPEFAIICIPGLVAFATVTASGNYLALYFINTLHMSAIATGLAIVPMSTAALISAPIASKLQHRLPNWIWFTGGLAAIVIGAWSATAVTPGDTWTYFVPALICYGIGLGIIVPTTSQAALHVAANVRPGMTSGVAATSRQIGTALGVAALGAVFASAARVSAGDRMHANAQIPESLANAATDLIASGGGIGQVPPLSAALNSQLLATSQSAGADGIAAIMQASAIISSIGIAAILLLAAYTRYQPRLRRKIKTSP